MKTRKSTLKLMAEYGCDPLWIEVSPYNLDLAGLPISCDLRDALYDWAKSFEDTFNTHDPSKSGFSTLEGKKAFEIEGASLFFRLKTELGCSFEVTSKIEAWMCKS